MTRTPISPVLLVLGPQGSGKGTQVALLAKALHLPVITMGELFRADAATGTSRGNTIKALIENGHLVPGHLWEAVLRDHVKVHRSPDGLILDAVIRSTDQLKPFNQLRTELGLAEPLVLFISVPETVSMDRLLKRGRIDDTREAIARRLSWNREQAEPIVQYFRERGRVIDINGDQPIEAVHNDIMRALAERGIRAA